MAKLTPARQRFADEYLVDLNATRAYKAAYPKVKNDETARANASRMLTNANVDAYIKKRMAERSQRTEIKQDRVLQELANIAFSNGAMFAKVVERPAVDPLTQQPIRDAEGKPILYQRVELTPTDKLSPDQRAAIAGIKETKFGIAVESCDKLKALELLGRHLGMFTGQAGDDIEDIDAARSEVFDDGQDPNA